MVSRTEFPAVALMSPMLLTAGLMHGGWGGIKWAITASEHLKAPFETAEMALAPSPSPFF